MFTKRGDSVRLSSHLMGVAMHMLIEVIARLVAMSYAVIGIGIILLVAIGVAIAAIWFVLSLGGVWSAIVAGMLGCSYLFSSRRNH
jgi:hypothetical protein